MRVAIAEDDCIYRTGVVRVLDTAGVTVAYEGDRRRAGGPISSSTSPISCGPLDISLSRSRPDEGLLVAERVTDRHPGVGILLLSAHVEYHYAQRFFAGGCAGRGYAVKEKFTTVAAPPPWRSSESPPVVPTSTPTCSNCCRRPREARWRTSSRPASRICSRSSWPG